MSSGDGTKSVYIKFKDAAGNESTSYSDSITYDATAPATFDLDSPGDNSHTSNQKPTFRWKKTTDATSGLSKYQVVVDSLVVIDNIDPTKPSDSSTREDSSKYVRYDGDYIEAYAKQDSNKLAAGERKWKVSAIDNAGNSRDSGERTLYIDLTIPTLQLDSFGKLSNLVLTTTSKEGNVYIITDQKPAFQGVADVGTTIKVTIESEPITCETTAASDSSWECTPEKKIPYGTHTVTITATDKAGNSATLLKFSLIVSSGILETEIIEEKTIPKEKKEEKA